MSHLQSEWFAQASGRKCALPPAHKPSDAGSLPLLQASNGLGWVCMPSPSPHSSRAPWALCSASPGSVCSQAWAVGGKVRVRGSGLHPLSASTSIQKLIVIQFRVSILLCVMMKLEKEKEAFVLCLDLLVIKGLYHFECWEPCDRTRSNEMWDHVNFDHLISF
jgi:hypothetical protein